MELGQTFSSELQRRLDFLDEYIDTLERENQAAGHTLALPQVEEANNILQKAREHYSRGDIKKAWLGVHLAEGCIIVGSSELDDYRRVSAEIDKLLG